MVGLDGGVRGGHPRPSSEVPLHLATYRVRPDVNAVVHLHPQTSVLLDALGHADPAADHRPRVLRARGAQHAVPPERHAGAGRRRRGGRRRRLQLRGPRPPRLLGARRHRRARAQAGGQPRGGRARDPTMLQLGDTTTVCPPEYLETSGRARPPRAALRARRGLDVGGSSVKAWVADVGGAAGAGVARRCRPCGPAPPRRARPGALGGDVRGALARARRPGRRPGGDCAGLPCRRCGRASCCSTRAGEVLGPGVLNSDRRGRPHAGCAPCRHDAHRALAGPRS